MKYFCIVMPLQSGLDDGDIDELAQDLAEWWEGDLKDAEALYIEAKTPYDAAKEAHHNATGRMKIATIAVFAEPPTVVYTQPSESFSYRVVAGPKPKTKAKRPK